MIRLIVGLVCVATVLAIVPCASAVDVVFGDFEGATVFGEGTGWFDWGGLVVGTVGTKGVTSGSQSLKWQPGSVGYYQGFAVKLQNLPTSGPNGDVRAAAYQGLLNNTHIAMDVSWDSSEWIPSAAGGLYSELYSLDFNHGPASVGGVGYVGQGFPDIDTGNPGNLGRWDPTNYPGIHTRTVMWDYSQYLPQIQATYNAGTINEVNNHTEFNLATNAGNFQYPVTYYFDNIRFTTPVVGVPGDYNNDGTVNAADYTVWRNNLGQAVQLTNEVAGTTPGQVTPEDYVAWKARFGNTSGSGGGSLAAGAVPEPAAWLLGLAAVSLLGTLRRGARRR